MPKGRKFCLKCNEGVGCRTKVCPNCGEPFSKAPVPAHRASDILPPPAPPSETPSQSTDDVPPPPVSKPVICSTHTRYGAQKPPQEPCETCWRAYLKERFGERVRPLDESIVLTANDSRELGEFIDSLKTARAKSLQTGGCYSAFLHAKGGVVLQIDAFLGWAER